MICIERNHHISGSSTLVKRLVGSGRVGIFRSQCFAFAPKKNRKRHSQTKSYECKQTRTPAAPQAGIELLYGHGKDESENTSSESDCGHCRCGVSCVCIDEVGLDALESEYAAARVYQDANVRDDPVCVSLCAPTVPKQPNRHEKTSSKHERQSKLGSANSIVLLLEAAIDTIAGESRYLGSNDWAEA